MEIMTDKQNVSLEIVFISKECKMEEHQLCNKNWMGLGIKANCGCLCHNNPTENNQKKSDLLIKSFEGSNQQIPDVKEMDVND